MTVQSSLQQRLYERLQSSPDRRAIAFYNRRGEYSWLTLEQFYQQAVAYAAQLSERGVQRGDVCILVLSSEEFTATLILATLILGAVPLLVAPPTLQGDAAYSNLAKILEHIIRRTSPRVVICEESMLGARSELEQTGPHSQFLFGEAAFSLDPAQTIAPVMPATTDVAAMQLTSGTTGFPRICVWQQQHVIAALDGMASAMQLGEDDVCLNWTPLYHDMGLVNNFLLCITTGTPLVMLNPKDFVKQPAIWLRALSETGATITWSPNFGFALAAQRVRDEQLRGVRLDAVRSFWNAAERIHLETMQDFARRFAPYGVRSEALKTNFGCAENVGGATFSDPQGSFVFERIDRVSFQNEGIARPVADPANDGDAITVVGAGRPHALMDVKILSESGRVLPDGHVGQVALETPSRMVGYLDDREATEWAIKGSLLRTGDLGYLRDGELFWVGRVRERITVRGKKLDPSDFEPILLQITDLREGCFAAFGVDDPRQGTQRIVVVSEVREETDRTPVDIVGEIRNAALQSLGISVDDVLLVKRGTLTKTSSGKRRHRYFRDRYVEGALAEFEWLPEATHAVTG